ncbi:MAG: MarR family transcriptional regulator [Candidatus Acidiferrales bacterium]|jgi:DNA-binding MarR family transcriptional regulator
MPRQTIDSHVIDLAQSIGLLIRRMRAAAASDGLSLTEAGVLKRLDLDGPATTADLARAESMRPQSMGATIATLEEQALVERRPHPTDGRQFNIQITAKGRALRLSHRDAKRTWIAEAITRLDEKDRETLFKAGEIIRRLADQ